MEKIDKIATIYSGNKKLVIIYDKAEDSLSCYFKDDKSMKDFIINNTVEVYNRFVKKETDKVLTLNIASTENFGAFNDWKGMQNLLNRQLSIFMPIIQRFILYANTGNLD